MEKAIGMVELNSISRGIFVADAMVKVSDVEIVTAVTTCPGKYIVIVHGDVAAVQTSVDTGIEEANEFFIDSMVIPNVHPGVFPALTGSNDTDDIDALGILESFSQATMLYAADIVLKTAELEGIELRLGTGLGGKSYFTFTGEVAAVKAGVEAGIEQISESGMLINAEVIASPSNLLIPHLY